MWHLDTGNYLETHTLAHNYNCTKIAKFCGYPRLLMGHSRVKIKTRILLEVRRALLEMNKQNIGTKNAIIIMKMFTFSPVLLLQRHFSITDKCLLFMFPFPKRPYCGR